MKEKKIFWIVILAMATMSFVVALVGAFFDSLTVFIDSNKVEYASTKNSTRICGGIFLLMTVACAAIFVAFFFLNKKNLNAKNWIMLGVLIIFGIITVPILRTVSLNNRGYRVEFEAENYSVFAGCFSTVVTLGLTGCIMMAARLILSKMSVSAEEKVSETNVAKGAFVNSSEEVPVNGVEETFAEPSETGNVEEEWQNAEK